MGAQGASPIPVLDGAMQSHMAALGIPGGALAIVRNHRLVYSRGYGLADPVAGVAAAPDTLFRIASITKPFTSAAVFKLVEQGRLDLSARAFDLADVQPYLAAGASQDPRLRDITVLHLLRHVGGWDRAGSRDPMFMSRLIAEALGEPSPPGPRDIVRFMAGQPLDFDPGSRFAYSNFGYCLLGRIIEQVTSRPYADIVRSSVLAPAGITRMVPGASRIDDRLPGEALYNMPNAALARSVFDSQPGLVPWPYGGYNVEAMDSHGGWVASVVDLMRFAVAMDPSGPRPLLRPASLATMYALPPAPVSRTSDGSPAAAYYGCGWQVRPVASGGANYWHNGSLPGSYSYLVRLANGVSWAALFNLRSDRGGNEAIDEGMNRAIESVRSWPTEDLFATSLAT